ncbi:hypothetical protein F4820DRAFT_443811 [Hypoxylon rubiginosum]|uniref:Uncharacterized protein n=1 Tax=Hypoxylon rubiginosum TaxID=110542 RepID=A0ACB9ZE22_9PEZI|nr:hypothetical protein F4820DRAFT_443811 [Hypoxylon rubiginosum]
MAAGAGHRKRTMAPAGLIGKQIQQPRTCLWRRQRRSRDNRPEWSGAAPGILQRFLIASNALLAQVTPGTPDARTLDPILGNTERPHIWTPRAPSPSDDGSTAPPGAIIATTPYVGSWREAALQAIDTRDIPRTWSRDPAGFYRTDAFSRTISDPAEAAVSQLHRVRGLCVLVGAAVKKIRGAADPNPDAQT